MRYLILAGLFSAQIAGAQSFFGILQDGKIVDPLVYLETDKVAHFGVGYITGATATVVLHKVIEDKNTATALGAFAAFVLGAGKELYDAKKGGDADELDAWATFYGGVAGAITVRYAYRIGRIKPEKKIRHYY